MEKNSFEVKSHTNPSIKVGDQVKIIDGSSLSCIGVKGDFYIVNQYPDETGSTKKLEDIVGTVLEVGITNFIVPGYKTGYIQDARVSFGKAQFRTCSEFLIKVKNEDVVNIGLEIAYLESYVTDKLLRRGFTLYDITNRRGLIGAIVEDLYNKLKP